MTNHLKFARRQTEDGATMVIPADIGPLNAVGNYLFSCDIEEMAARQMTETSERGIKFTSWTEKSVAALCAGAGRIPFAKDAVDHHRWPQIPAIRKRRSLAKGLGGTDAPGTDAAIGDQLEEAAVT
jgi:hypothetical protein